MLFDKNGDASILLSILVRCCILALDRGLGLLEGDLGRIGLNCTLLDPAPADNVRRRWLSYMSESEVMLTTIFGTE